MKRRPWEVNRRACLRGLGTAIGLPTLEAMMPGIRRARAAGEGAPRRLLFFVCPGGTPDTKHIPPMATFTGLPEGIPNSFWPLNTGTAGTDYEMTPILQALADVSKDVLLVQNLHNYVGTLYSANELYPAKGPNGTNFNAQIVDHLRGPNALFCGMTPDYNSEADVRAAKSCDQVAADALKGSTLLPSLHLGDEVRSDVFTRTTYSWRDATTRNNPIGQPSEAFRQVFGDGMVDPKTFDRQIAYKKSVLDFVKADRDRLSKKLGKADQGTLDKYLTSVRDLERRIASMGGSMTACGKATFTPNDDASFYPDHVKQWLDLVPLAFQCDRTRVVIVQLYTMLTYFKWLGDPNIRYQIYHDDIQHGASGVMAGASAEDIALRAEAYQNACRWEVEQFATLVKKLKDVPENDGSGYLLDNSLLVWTSEMSYGNGHDMTHLPVILAGKCGGAAVPGRHIAVREQPIANLWVSMLNAVGVSTTKFGNSDGALSLT